MTVDELLKTLAHAYPAFTVERMTHWAQVFRARLQHREGPHLDSAITETLAEFEPKSAKPFPIPVDFERHLPSIHREKSGAKPIGPLLEARTQQARKLFGEWHDGQGRKIKEARPHPVYAACVLEAYDKARKGGSRLLLTAEDIARCELHAVSCERVHRFGKLPKSPEAWQQQCEEIRAEWAHGQA